MIHIETPVTNSYSTNYICLGSKHKGTYIHKSQIVYIEACENYAWLHLHNGTKELSSKSIGYYEEILSQDNFTRIHRSYVINISYLHLYEPKYRWVHLQNDLILPVSFRRNRQFIKQLKNKVLKPLLKVAVL